MCSNKFRFVFLIIKILEEWKDPRLSFDADFNQIILSMKMLELIWKPDTFFLNGKESYLHKIPTSNR